ncbi:10337_t:CDS:1, partial [Dentiscutata heterogama]
NWDDYPIKDLVYFWNNFQSEIPELALFASRIMSIPPTSVDSERFWLVISNIYTPQWNRLTNDHAFKLTCIQWHMAQKENISLKQKEIDNLSQILQQDITMSNSEVSREKSSSINILSINSETGNSEKNYEDESQNLEESRNSQKLEESENSGNPEEEKMKTIENIDILDSNDQNAYCEVVSEYSQVVSYNENVLENWLLFDKLDNI